MPDIDLEKTKRETLRWLIMVTLNAARPFGTTEPVILSAVETVIPGVTQLEIRRELEYLENRQLVEISGRGLQPSWQSKLTHHGIDVVEYTVECYPGIGRPQKWW
jgi:hypothetical protein